MNEVNFDTIKNETLNKFSDILGTDFAKARDTLEDALGGLTDKINEIKRLKGELEIDEQGAKNIMDEFKNVLRIKLQTAGVIALTEIEKIINAIIDAFNEAVKKTLGGWNLF